MEFPLPIPTIPIFSLFLLLLIDNIFWSSLPPPPPLPLKRYYVHRYEMSYDTYVFQGVTCMS